MFGVKQRGSFKNLDKFLYTVSKGDVYSVLESLGQRGVDALASSTPVDSGITAGSWGYLIERENGKVRIVWTNSSQNQGLSIAILLQYGHGTGTGGYVEGRDYINPAIQPIFDDIADAVWQAIKNA